MTGPILASLIAGLAAGAVAADATAYTVLDLPDDRPAVRLEAPPLSHVRLGDFDVKLETTTLREVAARFGGALKSGGDAAGSAGWLCYVEAAHGRAMTVVWVISNSEMGGGVQVTQVAEQARLPRIPSSCSAPRGDVALQVGAPGIGSAARAVEDRFGGARPRAPRYLAFESRRPDPASRDFQTSQRLEYRFAGGVVETVSVSQVTSN